MNPLALNGAAQQQVGSATFGGIKTGCEKEQVLAIHVTALTEPMEVSLNVRTATAVDVGSTLACLPAVPSWLDKTVKDFAGQADLTAADVYGHIESLQGEGCKQPFIEQAEQSALKHVQWLHQRVSQYFADHGGANWQSCMDWLIRLPPAELDCRELLNLLPVELIESRPDLPRQLANKAQTIDQLAARARLRLCGSVEIGSDKYRNSTVNRNGLLQTYLLTTSTLRYRFLQAALQRAPLEKVEALLRHWLHDDACKDIAARLTAAPIHPTMITREEPLLQDLLTLSATRLRQPNTPNTCLLYTSDAADE